MKRTALAAIVLGVSISFGVAWQASADTNDDRAATLALIRKIVPRSAYDSMLTQMYTQMSASIEQAGGQAMPVEKRKKLEAAVRDVFPYEELINWSADIYVKHLTRKEIDDLAAFYSTPTGVKVASLLPTISGEIGAKVGPLMMTRLPEALKKRGVIE